MRMKAKIAAGVLLLAGLTAGCTAQPGVAATVNGEKVTIAEVDDGMALGDFFAQPPTPGSVVASIIQARAVNEAAQTAGLGVSAAQAADFLDSIGAQSIQDDGEYSPTVLELARMNIVSMNLQTAGEAGADVVEAVNEYMTSADIEFNPRYGTWDLARGGVVQDLPEWVETAQ